MRWLERCFADMTSDGDLRGYAAFDADARNSYGTIINVSSNVPQLMGSGHIAFTVDEGATGGRYRRGSSISGCHAE